MKIERKRIIAGKAGERIIMRIVGIVGIEVALNGWFANIAVRAKGRGVRKIEVRMKSWSFASFRIIVQK